MSGSVASIKGEGNHEAPVFDPFDVERVRARLTEFLRLNADAKAEVGALRRYTVGFSWVTYGFELSIGNKVQNLILRVGPPNGIFSPYKASPESITLRHLAGNGVPVPKIHWFSDAHDTFGAPFFICDLVPGDVPIPWTTDGGDAFGADERVRIGEQFLGALASLHNFDWRGKLEMAVEGVTDTTQTAHSQIDYWVGRMHEWSERRFPMLEWAAIWLRQNAPVAPRISVVHGDYRIGNFLEHKGRITSILDWELVHLGDPLEDLGWICLQAWRGRSPYMCHLFTRDELYERYEALTGIHLDAAAVRYWEAFGTFKLAVMHLGATHCYEARGFNDLRMAGMGAQVPRMLLQLETALERAA
ncbi:phosphotransferase family protein [Rhizobium sp. TH2]|uniref:phosphotransferase family protein n=1 Tax=Rhizobium sp. TH2 TaxID=2775403 RepID=UPI002158885A|nr:phosphotransferase family protein [Rhizobium sp. TH2]UVC08858.1 phosphotransferase family protein [Rhizobium sp. TH2]